MLRFTNSAVRNILRNVIQQTNTKSSLNVVTSRSHCHSESGMERTLYESSVEYQKTKYCTFNVKSGIIPSSNSFVETEIVIPVSTFHILPRRAIHIHSNKNPEEERSTNFSHTELDVMILGSDSSLFDAVKSDQINICSNSFVESVNGMSPSDSHLETKLTTTQSDACDNGHIAVSEVFVPDSNSHAGYMETAIYNDFDVESSEIKSYCLSIVKPYEMPLNSLADSSRKSNKEFEISTPCHSIADSVEVITLTRSLIESDEVATHNLSCSESEIIIPGNIFHTESDKQESYRKNVGSAEKRDNVLYTNSEMVIPDIESDAQSKKEKSRICIVSEEKMDSVAYADSEMLIPDNLYKFKICNSNVKSEVIFKRSDYHGLPLSNCVADSNTFPAMHNDNNAKPILKLNEEECEIMDNFFNDMKQYVQYINQEEFLEMLKINEFGPFVNPYTGELGGPKGPEPTRYGDWEIWGKCVDF